MKKIMFAMLKTLGDVIVSTTLVRELKRDYPDSEIFFYTNDAYAPVLANNPDIRAVKSSREWTYDMLFMELAMKGYDIAFLPYQARPECNVWHQDEETRHHHLVDFYWRRMGMHRPITERECCLYPSELDFLRSEQHISMDIPRIAIHTTTGVLTKNWPYFAELVEILRREGYATCQVGALSDLKAEGAIDFRGKMSLLELAAFLSKCAVFVGLDSGISYMADAMMISTIVIQGSTNPVTSGPISDRVVHLFAEKTGYDDCQVVRCHMNCRHETNCITSVKPEKVMETIFKEMEKNEDVQRVMRRIVPTGV